MIKTGRKLRFPQMRTMDIDDYFFTEHEPRLVYKIIVNYGARHSKKFSAKRLSKGNIHGLTVKRVK